jgi:hypothetical protein
MPRECSEPGVLNISFEPRTKKLHSGKESSRDEESRTIRDGICDRSRAIDNNGLQ